MNAIQTPTDLPIPEVVKELPVNKNADTNDWDTVFAIRFKDANTAITNSWSKVSDKAKTVSQAANDDPDYKLDAVLGPWQLTVGGDGKNIRMNCPFASGTYKASSKSYDMKGCQVIIEVGMEWVPNPDQFAFSITQNDEIDAIKADLNINKLNDTLVSEFKKQGKTLSATATASLVNTDKDWLVSDGKLNYYIFYYTDKYNNEFLQIYEFEDSWKNNLKLLERAVNSGELPVTIIQIINDPAKGGAAYILPGILSDWFNANIGEFNHVFGSLDLSPALSTKDNYKWIKPTGTSYAVTDNGTLDNSIFGVLTMTQGNQLPTSHQVSPNAIPDRDGANAGFLISGTAFMKNMMLGAARATFDFEPESSFDISNDGLSVTNNKKLTWGRFKKDDAPRFSVSSSYAGQLDNNQLPDKMVDDLIGDWHPDGHGGGHYYPNIRVQGYSVHATNKGNSWYLSSPDESIQYLLEMDAAHTKINLFNSIVFTIEAKKFTMSLVNSYLEIQFIDLLYPKSWECDVHINYTEHVSLGLKSLGGKQIFYFDQVTKNMTVSVTKTKAAIIVEIIEAVVFLIASAVPVIEGLKAAATWSEEAGNILIDAEKFEQVEQEISEVEKLENEGEGLVNGAKQVSGRWSAFKNAFGASRWKALGGIVGAIEGTHEVIETIMEAYAKGEWEKVPAFDEFANNAILPYSWPGVDGYDLKNIGLASSLQIGLKTQVSK